MAFSLTGGVLAATGTELDAGIEADVEALNPILPVVNELFYGLLFFLVMWALMKWVFLPPVLRTMAARNDQMRTNLEAADHADAEAEMAMATYQDSLASARAEAVQVIEAARAEAEEGRRQVLAAAESEAAAKRTAAMAEITQAKQAALEELRSGVGSVAVEAASTVVAGDIDASSGQELVRQYLAEAAQDPSAN